MKQFLLLITVLWATFAIPMEACAYETDLDASWMAFTATPGREWVEPFTGMEFVWVPAGCFKMGSPESEKGRKEYEGPLRKVCVNGFWMGKYEVTQEEWMIIMDKNPSHFSNYGTKDPVEKVSWDDAKTFIRKLNAKGVGTFRLPTEAEWEYACRAGTTTPYSFGNTVNTDLAAYLGLDSYDQMTSRWHGGTKPVGTFEPNKFGLYDMHGNVWEWCEDTYEWYPPGPADNPLLVKSGNNIRILRGGGWYSIPNYLRSAYRTGKKKDTKEYY
ncbi:MAG: formylglycine-generating enzyme family protein, partial [Spirochaetales bacterium]|nr:formylglycine-generating enzyme family protein [Spirochaetales bacterium]